MATLNTKIQRAGTRQVPALTVRRMYDPALMETRYQVRGRTGQRSLEYMGDARDCEAVLRVCRAAGYAVDEIVENTSWLCILKETTP